MEKIWLENYPKGVVETIDSKDSRTLNDLVDNACSKYAKNKAFTSHSETILFKDTIEYTNNLAASLVELGVRKGDRVAIIMPNIIQYPIAVFAVLRIGAVVVNINPLYTEEEIDYLLKDSAAKTVIVLNMMAHKLNLLYAKHSLKNVIVTKLPDLYPILKQWIINFAVKYIKSLDISYSYHAHNFCDLIKNKNYIAQTTVNADDLAFIQYTGATTGRPKGAMLLHRNIVANINQIYAWLTPQMNLNGQIAINALPLYHIFSLTANLFTFFFAGSENVMVINPRDVKDMVKTLNKTPFTVFSALDTLYNHLLNSSEFTDNKYPHFKYSVSGGMSIREIVASNWQKLTGVVPANSYGLTETSPAVSINLVSGKFDGSVGFPIPSTEIDIRDMKNHESLAVNQDGIIFVRGPQVMAGYWNNLEQTDKCLNADGWFNTGDIGHINQEGRLFISGRDKELIIVSGFNVYPAEIEKVIDSIEGIKESAVVGSFDDDASEIVNAFVVLKQGTSLDEPALRSYCRDKLTSYKVPRHFFILSELPKTAVGKIDKKILVQQYLTRH